MKRIWIPALSTLNAWLMSLKHSNYLQYRNTMLAKQPYFRFISLAFCDPAKSKAPAKTFAYWSNLWHSGKICSTVVNLWHRSQICGTASKSLAWQPMLWPAAKSAARQPQTYERWPIMWLGALQPDMRQNGQIAVQWPNPWNISYICDGADKSAAQWTNGCTSHFRPHIYIYTVWIFIIFMNRVS